MEHSSSLIPHLNKYQLQEDLERMFKLVWFLQGHLQYWETRARECEIKNNSLN
ncbi:hypothetical protein LguiA_013379 [Lonicera macranthoides]